MNESIRALEEKIAYLERHVTEQDKVMLEFAEELGAVRRELKSLRERSGPSSAADPRGEDDTLHDRPPHY